MFKYILILLVACTAGRGEPTIKEKTNQLRGCLRVINDKLRPMPGSTLPNTPSERYAFVDGKSKKAGEPRELVVYSEEGLFTYTFPATLPFTKFKPDFKSDFMPWGGKFSYVQLNGISHEEEPDLGYLPITAGVFGNFGPEESAAFRQLSHFDKKGRENLIPGMEAGEKPLTLEPVRSDFSESAYTALVDFTANQIAWANSRRFGGVSAETIKEINALCASLEEPKLVEKIALLSQPPKPLRNPRVFFPETGKADKLPGH